MTPPLCFPSFVRKDSMRRRPPLTPAASSTTTLPSIPNTPTSERATPFASVDTLIDEKNSGSLETLSDKNKTVTSLPLLPGSGFGWGKVVSNGKFGLSVSTFGSKNGEKSSLERPNSPESISPTPSMRRLDSTDRLVQLRALMVAEPDGGLDYYIVPTEDAHQSEYTAASDRRREFITGFTGSAGVALISRSEAHLFVDSRYYVQAAQEVDSNWLLHRVGLPGVQPWNEWIKDRPRGSRVGIDSRLISHAVAVTLSSGLKERYSKLVFPRVNLVDKVWKTRPPKPQGEVFFLDLKFTGKPATEKLDDVRAWIRSMRPPPPPSSVKSVGGTPSKPPMPPVATFISSLSAIAWLLNIRGNDVPFNPVTVAYLFVSTRQAILFIDKSKLNDETRTYLKSVDVSVKDYSDTWTFLRRAEWGEGKVLIDSKSPYAVALMLTSSRYVLAPSWVENEKGVKNNAEIQGFRNAHIRDGAAMVKWLAWLDELVRAGQQITEWEATEELTRLRSQGAHYWGLAYDNIAASGPNAALPHYTATKESTRIIDTNTPFLIDSGGQYFDGTIDTTRTVHFGFPSDEQMEAFTRVLQGHIAIDTAIFPEGTTGHQLDVLARKALWKEGMNYGHGTGHGVGSFLNVHEGELPSWGAGGHWHMTYTFHSTGPHSFSASVPLQPGHVITNEPGFYKEGHFGVRIESCLVVKKVQTRGQFGGDVWLGFERLTQVPITNKMVKMEMLSKEEKAWLKEHNKTVCARLMPLIEDDKRAVRWIRREITKSGQSTGGSLNLQWD